MSDAETGSAASMPVPHAAQHIESQSPAPEFQVKLEYVAPHPSSPSQAFTMGAPARHDRLSGERLKAIPKHRLVESGADYAEVLNELQIKPEHHDEIVTGILYKLRCKRIKNLQSATEARIKDLTFAFIRGYGSILYRTGKSKWLVPEGELRLAGKERLQFKRGEYTADGPNAHFYRILEPLWWIMRDLVFEKKKPSERPGQPPKRKFDHLSIQELGADSEYQGDNDTELDIWPQKDKLLIPRPRGRPAKGVPKVSFEQKQQQTLNRIDQKIDMSKRNGSRMQNLMTTEETNEAIFDLILRLHKIRCESDSEVFARSWKIHLGRLDEIEEISDLRRSPAETMEQTPNALLPAELPGQQLQEQEDAASGTAFSSLSVDSMEWMGEPTPSVGRKNLANEPFNTDGPPSVLNQLKLGATPLVPSAISVYIMTAPVSVAYHDGSYHWPDAPVSPTDSKRFWGGIGQRSGVRNISGYVLSYGWNDVMRSVHNYDEGRRHGFSVLRADILKAARLGVTRWRLKVLVSGDALGRA